jgi:CheY-like chemotaxis protein
VRAAEQHRPDVVLCDIGLPGLDGYAVARKLRGNPATAQARLIAVTAYGREEDRRRSHEAGFERHLVKPVDPDDLRRALDCPPS